MIQFSRFGVVQKSISAVKVASSSKKFLGSLLFYFDLEYAKTVYKFHIDFPFTLVVKKVLDGFVEALLLRNLDIFG